MQWLMNGAHRTLVGAGMVVLGLSTLSAAGSMLAAQQAPNTGGMSDSAMSHKGMSHDGMAKKGMNKGMDKGMVTSTMHDAMGAPVSGAFVQGKVSVKGGYTITSEHGTSELTLTPDFSLGKAPSPYVVLSTSTDLGENPVWLGALKSRSGAQQYEIPASTNMATYTHVVIWCQQAKVTLASAELSHGGAMSGMSH